MVYGLDTPRADVTQRSYDDLDLGSIADSFKSPGLDKNIIQNLGKGRRSLGHRSISTPLRPIVGGASRQGAGKEFTPLLKSVHMSQMKSKLHRNRASMPDSPIPGLDDADETFKSGNTTEAKLPEISSIASTPAVSLPRRRGKGAEKEVLQAEGQMLTLREQERIIDEIKKENFNLKMKLVFLEDKLTKGFSGPDAAQRAIKENIEIKVEKETLKAELKRAKKSLVQSEKAISDMRKEMDEMESRADKDFHKGAKSDEVDKLLQEAIDKLEDKERELEEVLEENEKLREEADGYFNKLNQLEHGADEEAKEVDTLHERIKELEGDKEDLETEVRRIEGEKDEIMEEVEAVRQDLKRKELELKEMQLNNSRDVGDKERELRELEKENRELRSEVSRLKEEKLGVEGNMDGALKTAHARIDSLQDTITTLESQLQQETRSKSLVIEERARLEARVAKLEDERKQLELKFEQMEDERDALDFEKKKLESERQKIMNERDSLEDDLENVGCPFFLELSGQQAS